MRLCISSPAEATIDEADLSALYSMPGVFLDFTAVSCFHKIDAGDVERELKQYGSHPGRHSSCHTRNGVGIPIRRNISIPRSSPPPLRNASSGSVGVSVSPTVDDRRGRAPDPLRLSFPWRAYHQGIVHSELLAEQFHCTALP